MQSLSLYHGPPSMWNHARRHYKARFSAWNFYLRSSKWHPDPAPSAAWYPALHIGALVDVHCTVMDFHFDQHGGEGMTRARESR
jgi:hypothetical protein